MRWTETWSQWHLCAVGPRKMVKSPEADLTYDGVGVAVCNRSAEGNMRLITWSHWSPGFR